MSRKLILTVAFVWMTAVVLALGASSASATTVISDSIFLNSDWTHSILWSNGAVSLGPVGQVLVGGNPNEYQQGRHTSQGPFAGLYDGHLFVGGGSYDPSTQGAIAGIDVSYDYKDLVGFGTQNGLLIEQGPKTFIYFVDSNGPHPQWTNLSASGIVDTWNPAWVELTGGVITDFTTPDFSAGGLPLTFGYYTFNWSLPQGFLIDHTWGVDNFGVTITPVPEPAALSFFALSGVTMLLRGRNRRRF